MTTCASGHSNVSIFDKDELVARSLEFVPFHESVESCIRSESSMSNTSIPNRAGISARIISVSTSMGLISCGLLTNNVIDPSKSYLSCANLKHTVACLKRGNRESWRVFSPTTDLGAPMSARNPGQEFLPSSGKNALERQIYRSPSLHRNFFASTLVVVRQAVGVKDAFAHVT